MEAGVRAGTVAKTGARAGTETEVGCERCVAAEVGVRCVCRADAHNGTIKHKGVRGKGGGRVRERTAERATEGRVDGGVGTGMSESEGVGEGVGEGGDKGPGVVMQDREVVYFMRSAWMGSPKHTPLFWLGDQLVS